MGQITNGTIEYSRRLRTGDFEHKDAKVSLSFTVAEDEDAAKLAQYVGRIAHLQAAVMVGEAPPSIEGAEKPAEVQGHWITSPMRSEPAFAGQPWVAPMEVVSKPEKPTRAKRNPSEVVIGASPTQAASVGMPQTVPQPEPANVYLFVAPEPVVAIDPMTGQPHVGLTAVVGPSGGDAMGLIKNIGEVASPTFAPVAAGLATDAFPSVPSGISDAELTGLISQKVQHLAQLIGEAAVPKVVELVEQFVPAPGRSTQMTQEQRAEFVVRLKSLT